MLKKFLVQPALLHLVRIQLLITQILKLLDAHLCFTNPRYKFLMRAIRFDDKNKREKNRDGSWVDKLVHIREVSYESLFQLTTLF